MLASTKEEIFPTAGDPRVCFSFAARAGVSENSRLGFTRKNVALHRGNVLPNYRTTQRDSPGLAPRSRQTPPTPQTAVLAKPWNPCRTTAIVGGVADLGLGILKIGLGLITAPETGGVSLYGAYSGLTNLVSSGGELYGGISGNLAHGERVATYASAYSTVSGAITTIATGNVQYGANASTIEGLAFVGVTGALTSTGTMKAAGALEKAVSAADNGIAAGGLAGIGACHN